MVVLLYVLGLVSNFAGQPGPGLNDGVEFDAYFYTPNYMRFNSVGDLIMADAKRLRRVTTAAVVSTMINELDVNGDAVGVSQNPVSLEYLFTDENAVRRIRTNGAVVLVADEFVYPQDVAVDTMGNAYISEQSKIWRISTAGNELILAFVLTRILFPSRTTLFCFI